MSTMARSDSLAVSMVAIFSLSAFFFNSSLVISVTAFCASMACWLWLRPRASTIWLFHRGMVFTREDWIFSDIRVSLFWSRRIWGPIWMETIRVSSRSWSFFSKRRHMAS